MPRSEIEDPILQGCVILVIAIMAVITVAFDRSGAIGLTVPGGARQSPATPDPESPGLLPATDGPPNSVQEPRWPGQQSAG